MDTRRFFNQNVVITGGSSGIGLAIALEFAKIGSKLFLLARHPERLMQAKNKLQQFVPDAFIETISIDIANQLQMQDVMTHIAKEYQGIHTLINNAGIVSVGLWNDLNLQEIQRVMEVNYFGAVYATKAAWPYLIQAKGHLGFVSSVVGYLGLVGYAGYAPAKFAMTGLVQCLRPEAKKHGLGVTIVYPPDTDTPQLTEENQKMIPELARWKRYGKVLQPEDVAKKFVNGILKNKAEVFCDFSSRLARIAAAIYPQWFC